MPPVGCDASGPALLARGVIPILLLSRFIRLGRFVPSPREGGGRVAAAAGFDCSLIRRTTQWKSNS